MSETTTNASDNASGIAALTAVVLDQEAQRQAHQAAVPRGDAHPHDLLPGVGIGPVSLRDALRREGRATFGTAGAIWFFALFEFAVLAVLAPDLQRQFDLGDRFLVNVVMAPALLFFVAQPVGNLVDRTTTNRPRVMGAMVAVAALALAVAGLTANRWVFLVACALAGLGLLASQPAQVALLADRYPLAARAEIFSGYTTIGLVAFVIGPLVAGLGAAAATDAHGGWRIGFLGAAVLVAVLAFVSTRVGDVRRGRNEVEAVFGDDRDPALELPSFAHVLARFGQIRTLRLMTVGVVVLGFALLAWGLSLNLFLARHFHVDTTDRALLLAAIAVPGVLATPWVGAVAGRWFRASPAKVVGLAAMLLLAFNVSVVGLWMPNVALLAVCEALGFVGVCGALATLQPVVHAVIPPHMRGQAGAAFTNSLFVGASGGAAVVVMLVDSYGRRTTLSVAVPLALAVGAGLMAYAARFVEPDIGRVVEELREERTTFDLITAGSDVPMLQVRNLDFSYGTVQVLFDIDLDIRKGETVALLGTNGAGKSTLLRLISGLAIPSRGVIRLDGHAITYEEPTVRVRRGIVQVPGGHSVFAPLTVRENLRVGAFLCDPSDVDGRIDRSLELFPALRSRMDEPAGTLSGGQQQMLGLAKALVLEPELLLIDELSLGLAPVVVQELLGVVEELKTRGVTMIIVEQSVNVGLLIADRAVFMEKGEVRFEGSAEDLLDRDDLLRAVFFGSGGG